MKMRVILSSGQQQVLVQSLSLLFVVVAHCGGGRYAGNNES